jgi:hypothetical protein
MANPLLVLAVMCSLCGQLSHIHWYSKAPSVAKSCAGCGRPWDPADLARVLQAVLPAQEALLRRFEEGGNG